MAAILGGDGLDRRHQARVRALKVEVHPKRVVVLAEPDAETDISLELYAADERRALLESVLGRRVEIAATA